MKIYDHNDDIKYEGDKITIISDDSKVISIWEDRKLGLNIIYTINNEQQHVRIPPLSR